jgi:hypothetical protein
MQKLWQAKPFGAYELMKQPVMMLVAVVALTLSLGGHTKQDHHRIG